MTIELKPFLMGSETEFSVSGCSDRHVLPAETLYDLLADAIRRERLTLPDRAGYRGLFAQHGGRVYLDYGSHPEHATPECQTPVQVAAYDLAAERLLTIARDRALAEHPGWQIAIVKTNLDPVNPDEITFGTHESYTCWVPADVAAGQLIAHLVTRTSYAGAGGLTGHANGQGFELSQRARHLHHVTGGETTGGRAIYSTRIRKPSDYSRQGWTRAHLVGKDSQRSAFGIYLTFATTGLLFLLINAGRKVGQGLQLDDPLRSLKEISRDPWLRTRVRLADGRSLTALEIQQTYQEECEREVQQGGMPDWCATAVRHWGETLAGLTKDPLRLADRLDPYCKLLIYGHELQRAGYGWRNLQQALFKLAQLRAEFTEDVVQAVVRQDPRQLDVEGHTEFERAVSGYGANEPSELARLHFAIRMQALELRYHELGGLHDRLKTAGTMTDVILTATDVDRATQEPPAGGRAAARSASVRECQEGGWSCDWQYVWHGETGRCYDLRDPFIDARPLRQFAVNEANPTQRVDVLEQLAQVSGSSPTAAPPLRPLRPTRLFRAS